MTKNKDDAVASPHSQKTSTILRITGLCLALVIFLILAAKVYLRQPIPGDGTILTHIHSLTSPLLTRICIFLTDLGSASVVITAVAFAVMALWLNNSRDSALILFLAAAGTSAINVVAKIIFTRARPELWHHLVIENDYSFPSGHAMITSAMALTVILLTWRTKYRWLAIVLGGLYAVLVGFSRLYLGVHYPSDILGGWCLSILWISALYYVLTRYYFGRNTTK